MRQRSELRPAQNALIDQMETYPDGIMVLGMGGGKTASALTSIHDLTQDKEITHAIVLAPSRVVDNVWPHEPAKWHHLAPLMSVTAIVGTPAQRAKKLRGVFMDKWGVAVVSIENVQWLVDELKKMKQPLGDVLLVIDEISKFKNPRSKRGRKLLSIADQFHGVWGLTGTPRPNGWEDLFLPIKLVGGKDVWGVASFDKWRRENFQPLDWHGYRWAVHEHKLPYIRKTVETFMSYAPVDDLVKPELRTGDDFVRTVQMTPAQRDHYDDMTKELIASGEHKGLAWLVQAMSQGVASGKLTQIVQGFLYQDDMPPIPFDKNPKLDMLLEMDEELSGDSAIICYGLRNEIAQIEAALAHREMGLLGGGVSSRQAIATIAAWNAGEIDRLLLHPASAGHGVELQFGGHHMIWYHPTWSSELYDQTIKRIDRPGQEHPVTNWQILMDASNDLVKYARVESKMDEEEAVRRALPNVVGEIR